MAKYKIIDLSGGKKKLPVTDGSDKKRENIQKLKRKYTSTLSSEMWRDYTSYIDTSTLKIMSGITSEDINEDN